MWGQSADRKKHDVFFDVQAASRFDVGGRYDSTHFDLTLGYKPNDKWLIMLQNYTATREPESAFGFAVGRQSYWKFQPSLTYHYRRKKKKNRGNESETKGDETPLKRNHSLQLSYTKTLSGRSIVAEEGVAISYWYRF